jgi:hypothetical protein
MAAFGAARSCALPGASTIPTARKSIICAGRGRNGTPSTVRIARSSDAPIPSNRPQAAFQAAFVMPDALAAWRLIRHHLAAP